MILGTAASRSIPVAYGWIIDNIEQNNYTFVIYTLIGILVFKTIGDVIKGIGDQFNDLTLLRFVRYARIKFITAIQSMDYAFHAEKSSGKLISISKRGENAIYTMMVDVNIYMLEIIIEYIVAIVIVMTINFQLGLILLVIIACSLVTGIIAIKYNIKYRRRANAEDDNISALTVDNLLGFETVKIFAKEEEEQQRFREAYKPWYKVYVDFSTSFRWIEGSLAIIGTFGFVLSVLYGIIFIQNNTLTIGEFVASMTFVFGVITKTRDIVYKIRQILKVYIDLGQYFENMDLEPHIKDISNPKQLKNIKGRIDYIDLNFSYSKSDDLINNLNLTINEQETVAFVGYSGGGKTTLTKLLMRFYDPSSGYIKIDNIDIKNLSKRNLRKQIGLVPQDPILFNDTIAFNIAYSKPNSSMQEIKDAAKKANLSGFVDSLPKKYDTVVGERGIKLSGGQKQRLAIARVMLENPPIIIFDEATSQLDSENESMIHKAFENLTKNKTTIIIAHRLSTVKNADKIVVMNNGEIAESGTHTELIQKGGIYSQLWKLQTNDIL